MISVISYSYRDNNLPEKSYVFDPKQSSAVGILFVKVENIARTSRLGLYCIDFIDLSNNALSIFRLYENNFVIGVKMGLRIFYTF